MEDKDLENNKIDYLASVLKAGAGMIPVAGSLLSELVANIIPDQRIDRLIKYAKELDKRLSNLPVDILNVLKTNEEFIDLIEEGFVQASRAITDARREYIASIVTTGLTNESLALQESKYLLKILEELNDAEILWLKSSYSKGQWDDEKIDEDEEFRNLHKETLNPQTLGMPLNIRARTVAFIDNYKLHLLRLGLVTSTDLTGRETSYIRTTELGDILLRNIGII